MGAWRHPANGRRDHLIFHEPAVETRPTDSSQKNRQLEWAADLGVLGVPGRAKHMAKLLVRSQAHRGDSVGQSGRLVYGRPDEEQGVANHIKEVALLYGEGSFEPRVFEHLPGVANGLADALSRLDEPGAGVKLPAELSDITPAVVPTRTKQYYRILAT